jgi:hypothetical protein
MRARDNPFRSESILRVRYRLLGIEWDQLLGRCEQLHYRAALVGPCGSGKTTLLEDLEPRLRAKGFETVWLRLNQESSLRERWSLSKQTTGQFLLFDGAEQLSWVAWQFFKWRTRRAAGLIITTHKPGRLPTLWKCNTSAGLLSDIMAEVLAGSRFTPPADLFRKHKGNLREALRECYDLMACGDHDQTARSVVASFFSDTAPCPATVSP